MGTLTYAPNGCKFCGIEERIHASRFSEEVGQHLWVSPSNEQRLARMKDK